MKQISITLRNKRTQKTFTYYCHLYVADSLTYHLCGVKGYKGYDNEMIFNKAEWERI